MTDKDEGRLSRWSRLKRARTGAVPDRPGKKGRARPVVEPEGEFRPWLPPLADGAETGPADEEAATGEPSPDETAAAAGNDGIPATAGDAASTEDWQEVAAAEAEAEGLASEEEGLTPEEEEVAKNLPPIESLDRNSNYLPFFAEGVPEKLKRLALRKLWRSDSIFAVRDGLNDYDEDFGIAEALVESVKSSYRVGKGMPGPGDDEAAEQDEAPEADSADGADDSDLVDDERDLQGTAGATTAGEGSPTGKVATSAETVEVAENGPAEAKESPRKGSDDGDRS